jgi:hypothetical protein
MPAQSYKNHSRYVPMYHFVLLPLIGLALVLSIWNAYNAFHVNHGRLQAIIFFILSDAILAMCFFIRGFALKAQDRAIRAEEHFRHFVLTGKPLDSKLRMSQIIALRFAQDDEFPSLAQKAAEQNLKPSEIKKSIQNWKADHHRA